MTLPVAQLGQGIDVQFPVFLASAPISASFTVEDADGLELLAANVPPSGLGTGVIGIVIPGAINATRGLRIVRLNYVGPGGIGGPSLEFSYRVGEENLVIQGNSFDGYGRLLDLASLMTGVDAFMSADRSGRIRALAEAWRRICSLRISEPPHLNRQDRLTDVPWLGAGVELDTLSADELAELDPRLLLALRRAQIVEADAILGPDQPAVANRLGGLVSNKVGESEQVYRMGKPLETRVSARTMRELGGFVSFSVRIGR